MGKKIVKNIVILGLFAAFTMLVACNKGGVKGTMVISGGQEYIYAPHTGSVTTEPFIAWMVSGDKTERLTNVTWKIISSSKGASISADGMVTVTENYIAGDINGTDITIQATHNEDASIVATATLHVREAQSVASFNISMPNNIRTGESVEVYITECIDQYGEPITDTGFISVKWETSDESLLVVDGRLHVRLRTKEEAFAAVRATINGVSVVKKFIVHNKAEYSPSADVLASLEATDIEIIKVLDADFDVERTYDINQYTYVNEAVLGLAELVVDVKGMVNYSTNTDYQVTYLYEDASIKQEDLRADSEGKIKLAFKDKKVKAVEVTPVLKFSLGNCSYTETQGYVKVPASVKYNNESLYGFYGEPGDTAGGVNLFDDAGLFVVAIPDGFYDIRITKSGAGRSTVKVNGASLGTNVGNPGTGGRTGTTPYTYLMEDVMIDGGLAKISLGEKDYGLAAVEVRRTTQLRERRVHVYIGGDSTASNYYPIEVSEPEAGRYQTGWGQVFSQFVTDDIVVTNLAGGGTYAKSWYEMAFPGVLQNGQPGDYFIIQEGINDRTYSNQDEMVEYLTKMIDECREKGIIVVLVTTMQTPKFWRDGKGTDLGEFGTPEGGGLAAFMESIRALATEKNVFLADSGKITGDWFAEVGRTYVAQTYHIYNKTTGVEEDTLHLSYHGALNVAGVVATTLYEQQQAGAKDGMGNTLDGLKFNELAPYEAVHKDKFGETVTSTTMRVKAVYERYAE
ncbi:MAG: hypothetical protein E7261_11730 [Lachnospiraceae bacterium]|nr:hypothetical protein [Lachnospiraceae bacterium]